MDRKTVERIVREMFAAGEKAARRMARRRRIFEKREPGEAAIPIEPPEVLAELSLDSITFSDGTRLAVDKGDVILLVGPNNAGKSRALTDTQTLMLKEGSGQVVTAIGRIKTGNARDFERFLQEVATLRIGEGSPKWEGYKFRIDQNWARSTWENEYADLLDVFSLRIATESRITGSNPADAINFVAETPKVPIHRLYTDPDKERAVSDVFEKAFGEKLSLFRAGGSKIPLQVGAMPVLAPDESPFAQAYVSRALAETVPLHRQGDGMRSFATVVMELACVATQTLILIDEPEAFLHPPQARALGGLCVRMRPPEAITLVATHSADVLEGALSQSGKVRIVRLRRDGKLNHARELHADQAREITNDPLLRFFGVLGGLFHERVIICESDADCMFYNAVLEAITDETPDVLFLHANGKQRLAKVAKVLRALDVPVSVVADIDALNDETLFKGIVESLGGNWASVRPSWLGVTKAILERDDWPKAGQTVSEIADLLAAVDVDGEFPSSVRGRIGSLMRQSSPWGRVKASGRAALPSGQATNHFDQLLQSCSEFGLWVVPVGELEGFCRSIDAQKGPRWVQRVLEERDLAQDAELSSARDFVAALWGD